MKVLGSKRREGIFNLFVSREAELNITYGLHYIDEHVLRYHTYR